MNNIASDKIRRETRRSGYRHDRRRQRTHARRAETDGENARKMPAVLGTSESTVELSTRRRLCQTLRKRSGMAPLASILIVTTKEKMSRTTCRCNGRLFNRSPLGYILITSHGHVRRTETIGGTLLHIDDRALPVIRMFVTSRGGIVCQLLGFDYNHHKSKYDPHFLQWTGPLPTAISQLPRLIRTTL